MIDKVNTFPTDNSRYFLNTYPEQNTAKRDFEAKSNKPAGELSDAKKAFVFGTSALGVGSVLAFMSKKQGFSLNPARILKTPIKDWAIFKYKPVDKALKIAEPLPIIAMAIASIAGGLIGGAIVDKENFKAKKREALNQILGDVLAPIACVATGAKGYRALEPKWFKIMPQIKKDNTLAKVINNIVKFTPKTAATLVPLVVGILAGNKVSNFINEKLYHKKVDRHVRITDFAPHVDDLCMSISMVNEDSTTGSAISRVIPLAMVVPGYETGKARS